MIKIGPSEESILAEITEKVVQKLDSAGLFNRVFSRIKDFKSIERKISYKQELYDSGLKKMQDVFGVRITLYFFDDEDIAIKLIKDTFKEVLEARSVDNVDKDRFGPQRCNLVFRIDEDLIRKSYLFDNKNIDSTFEVQFRTVFSEGWHEVEHDLRYKCKESWHDEGMLSRQLNGQLATLETCNWAIVKIFDELAYKKYKLRDWVSFFRNVLRIRFEDDCFSERILDFFNGKPIFAKNFFKIERERLIVSLTQLTTRLPLKMDNVLFIMNRALLIDEDLVNIEYDAIKQILDKSFNV
jgi:ppGpp synthetase/RelA/SpoT-type nucleotidyltranferase